MPEGTMDNQSPEANEPQAVNDPTNWHESIPTGLTEEPMWNSLKGQPLSTVLKGYAEAQKAVGGMIKLPQGEHDLDGRNRIYDHMGRPETAESYELALDDSLMEWDQETLSAYKTEAHKLGISQNQLQGLMDWYQKSTGDSVGSANAEASQATALTEVKMRQEFGANYDYNKGIALRAASEYFGEEIAQGLGEDISGNEGIFRGLLKLGRELAEHGVFGSNPHANLGGVSPSEAQTKIAEVNGDKSHPYWDKMNPNNAKAQQDMSSWFRLAYPTG